MLVNLPDASRQATQKFSSCRVWPCSPVQPLSAVTILSIPSVSSWTMCISTFTYGWSCSLAGDVSMSVGDRPSPPRNEPSCLSAASLMATFRSALERLDVDSDRRRLAEKRLKRRKSCAPGSMYLTQRSTWLPGIIRGQWQVQHLKGSVSSSTSFGNTRRSDSPTYPRQHRPARLRACLLPPLDGGQRAQANTEPGIRLGLSTFGARKGSSMNLDEHQG
jgi:hypothetical protein